MRLALTTVGPLLAIALVVPVGHAAIGPLNDLLALGQAGGQKPDQVADGAASRAAAASPPRARTAGRDRKPGAGDPGPGPGRLGDGRPALQRRPGRPPGHLRRLQGAALRRRAGHECAYYDTALLFPVNALKLDTHARRASPCSTCPTPRTPVQTDTLTELPMMSPHESLDLNPSARAAGRGARQPGDLPGPGLDLRRRAGLPPPGAAVDPAGRPHRPRERLLARRQDVLRDRHRDARRSPRST